MTSPSTCNTSGMLTTCTPSSRVCWFQEEGVSKGTGSQCFSQPWTRCTPVKIWKKFSTIWTNPELRCTKLRGEFTEIQYIGAIWRSLREKDCRSIKHNRTQSLFSTCDLHWESGIYEDWQGFLLQSTPIPKVTASRHGRHDPSNLEAGKSADHQSEQSVKYRETRRSHLQNSRHKHLAENHRAKYNETCRGNVDYRIQGIPHSTVQKEDYNRKEIVKKTDSTVRESSSPWLVNLGFAQDWGLQSVQRKVEGVDHMGNTEYFEMCETSSKIQCPDFA